MPELPEVETVRDGLERHLVGARIAGLEVARPDLRFPLPVDFADRVRGRVVRSVDRRAKYLLIRLDRELTWLVHLGMSGRFSLLHPEQEHDPTPHDHVVAHLEDGGRAVFTDPRRFGVMDLLPTGGEAEHPLLAHLGPEPLDDAWDPAAFCASLRGRRTSIKAALLDQKTVVGVGNIYACEALFHAGISPRRLAASVAGRRGVAARARRLHAAIQMVLGQAIAVGGSTLRDFRSVDGQLGYFAHQFQVYGRESEPCPRRACPGTVRRLTQSGRSTFMCGQCQR